MIDFLCSHIDFLLSPPADANRAAGDLPRKARPAPRSETGTGTNNKPIKIIDMTKLLYDRVIAAQLAKEFKNVCTGQTIRNALNGRRKSVLADHIRTRAISLGAQEKGEETVKHIG
jgi:hypothetical protein